MMGRRSADAIAASRDVVSKRGGDLTTPASEIESSLYRVGDFKAGDMILDLFEPCFGMWTFHSGQCKQLARNGGWYSGLGARKVNVRWGFSLLPNA